MAKPKPRRAPPPSAENWLLGWARAYGFDLHSDALPQAAEFLLGELEKLQLRGEALPADLVRLAALLVRLQGEMLIADAQVAQPFIERAYARERARSLARQLDRGPLLQRTVVIGEPEEPAQPAESPEFTLYDLLQQLRYIMSNTHPTCSPKEQSACATGEAAASPADPAPLQSH
jgi:hypothetical protein